VHLPFPWINGVNVIHPCSLTLSSCVIMHFVSARCLSLTCQVSDVIVRYILRNFGVSGQGDIITALLFEFCSPPFFW